MKKLAKKVKKTWSKNQFIDIKRLALKNNNTNNISIFKNILLDSFTSVLS